MTTSTPGQVTPTAENVPQNSKEINFRQQEAALKAHYERQLEQERRARLEAERVAEEAKKRQVSVDEDEDSDPEPYVDHKKLKKVQQKYKQEIKQETQSEIQKAIQQAQSEARREAWLEANNDFEEILSHAEKLEQKSPTLCKTILKMPDNFERQKLVYQTIKEMGLHKPEEKKASIQQTIDNNKRGQFYQPSGISPAPYQGQTSDFSKTGQAEAYKKMQSLIHNVRL